MKLTTKAMLDAAHKALEDDEVRKYVRDRLMQLRRFEDLVIAHRIIRDPEDLLPPPLRGKIALEAGIHASHASRLERRLIGRVLAIIKSRTRT